MSENTALIDQAAQLKYCTGRTFSQEGNPPVPGPGDIDPLFLAYYYLVEATNTSAHGAVIHAKQLEQNALSQQRLDDQAANLKWAYVPKEIIHKHQIKEWKWTPKKGGYFYVKIISNNTYPNIGQVEAAQAYNQQVVAERATISDKLAVMQQLSHVGATQVNSLSDESTQTMQSASHLLDLAMQLTYCALMRQPPQ